MEQELHAFLAENIIQQVKSKSCRCLEYAELASQLELIIHNEKVVNILRNTPIISQEIEDNCIGFNVVYRKHFIENNQEFQLLNSMNSFALSWLCYLYH